jgi:L-alanine-DL-glutamate epimerase-like enolase superfamily enzyme
MADDEASYRHKLRQAAGYPLIKLKLGAPSRADDMALVHIAKSELPNAEFCIDANAAWSAPETLDLLPQLDELGILFIEQPLAKDDWMGWETLQKQCPAAHPPLIADESVQGLASLVRLVGLVDGINIKLAKCGGLDQAQQMIIVGRFFGLQIMLGCMIESSVGITAASHLAPLADYLDLDGNLLIQNDPYQGITVQGGVVRLPATPGLGLVRT